FRYARQQGGRSKEHFELNMDIIGETSALADAELIAAAIDIMRAFGFGPGDFKVRISDRRVLRTLLLGYDIREDSLLQAFAMLDKTSRDEEWVTWQLGGAYTGSGQTSRPIRRRSLIGLEPVSALLSSLPGGGRAGERRRG